MPDVYPTDLTRRSREILERVRAWAPPGQVTIIGGWAVHALVDPRVAQPSKDLDLVLHSEAALGSFDAALPGWGLAWRTRGRTRFKDCHFRDDPERRIVVDVFTTAPFGANLFGRQAATNLKPRAEGQALIPATAFLLEDKLLTIPLRQGVDALEKRLKDLLDVRSLVFHNRDGLPPRALLGSAPPEARRRALSFIGEVTAEFPRFGSDLEGVARWLAEPPR